MNKVFLDTNILLDLSSKERKFSDYSIKTVKYLLSKGIDLYTSSDIITTVYYVLVKHTKDKKLSLEAIKEINTYVTLIEFSNREVEKAVELMEQGKKFRDLEDTLQYVLAKKKGCQLILSNNRDFYSPDIEVLNTREFCKRWNIES